MATLDISPRTRRVLDTMPREIDELMQKRTAEALARAAVMAPPPALPGCCPTCRRPKVRR